MNIWKSLLISLIVLAALAACSPQADDAMPTLAVLPSLAPSDIPPTQTAPPTPLPPTEASPTPLPSPTLEVAAVQQQPIDVATTTVGENEGQVLPGCDTWATWDASRVDLRDSIYSQPPLGEEPVFLAEQVREYRDAVALLDYDECLIEARAQYLLALDEAALALEAADRSEAQTHEQNAGQAMTNFEQALASLTA